MQLLAQGQIHDTQCVSPCGEWVVFDNRETGMDIRHATAIRKVNVYTGEVVDLYLVCDPHDDGPGVAAATFSPDGSRIAFIHGIRPYGFASRFCMEMFSDGEPIGMRDRPPLQGGTHAHTWHPNGAWISCTYNDARMAHDDRRTVAVLTETESFVVADPWGGEYEKAFDECWLGHQPKIAFQGIVGGRTEIFIADLSAVLDMSPSPSFHSGALHVSKDGADEVDHQCPTYPLSPSGGDGAHPHPVPSGHRPLPASQGEVSLSPSPREGEARERSERGGGTRDLPPSPTASGLPPLGGEDLPQSPAKQEQGAGSLRQGNPASAPPAPRQGEEVYAPLKPSPGITIRRLTYSAGIQGVRHWLRADCIGQWIACLMHDERGISQVHLVDSETGEIWKLTANDAPVDAPICMGNGKVAYSCGGRLCITDMATSETVRTEQGPTPINGVAWAGRSDEYLITNRVIDGVQWIVREDVPTSG